MRLGDRVRHALHLTQVLPLLEDVLQRVGLQALRRTFSMIGRRSTGGADLAGAKVLARQMAGPPLTRMEIDALLTLGGDGTSNDTLSWFDSADPKQNFEFKVSGLKKVWFTCEQQQPSAVCTALNFEIVKGESYSFRDVNRASGSSTAIVKLMDTLKAKFPQLPVASPKS